MLKRIVLIAVAGVSLLLFAPSAHAQSSGQPVVGVSCTFFNNGTVTCTATNFQSGSTVTFTIASTPTLLGTAVADASGTATLSTALPRGIDAGSHTVTASGVAADGTFVSTNTQGIVTPEAAAAANGTSAPATTAGSGTTSGGSLPRTGSDSVGLVKIAVLLVAFGGAVVLVTRKRRGQLTA